jgi:hypothetical protein
MSVYKKLQEARVKLHTTQLNKSGENKFAKFKYFELGDFIPQVTEIFNKVGLCGVVSFTSDTAYLTVHETKGDGFITFTTPLVYASVEKTQPIQNLGSTHTYIRRYLWLMAMEIVENDVVDSVEPKSPEPKPYLKGADEGIKKVMPKPEQKKKEFFDTSEPWQVSVDVTKDGWPDVVKQGIEMLIKLAKKPEDVNSIYKINMQLLEQLKIKDVATFDEIFATFKTTKETLKGQA